MRKILFTRRAQSILEYAILISVICLVLLTMSAYMRRSVQAKLTTIQDRANEAVR
ncbi:MAG: hypothetical protein HZB36_03515 [Candidatus Omnitrophica bacterium]|nr:hypothetical protein [Candidatus Omnitrophota bacterium]